MGIRCGSQVLLCEYPVSLDTYRNCTHACKYCFAQSKASFIDPEPMHCAASLRNFIAGKRTATTNWCDFPIPLHWGGMSDPLQPAEAEHKASLECLKVFAETGYPFIVSTKGRLVAEEPYISLLERCNAVVQISMVCPDYDPLEPGAPTFEERLVMARKLSGRVKRVIARAQPYIVTARKSLVESIPAMAEAGIYGLTVEGMKFKRKKPGTVKVRGDWCYPQERLEQDYITIRDACRKSGMAFFCAENRLRSMGDSTSCCGCGDLEGFGGNKYNLVSIAAGGGRSRANARDDEAWDGGLLQGDIPGPGPESCGRTAFVRRADDDGGAQGELRPTEAMTRPGTAMCFKALHQDTLSSKYLKHRSFATQMAIEAKTFEL